MEEIKKLIKRLWDIDYCWDVKAYGEKIDHYYIAFDNWNYVVSLDQNGYILSKGTTYEYLYTTRDEEKMIKYLKELKKYGEKKKR